MLNSNPPWPTTRFPHICIHSWYFLSMNGLGSFRQTFRFCFDIWIILLKMALYIFLSVSSWCKGHYFSVSEHMSDSDSSSALYSHSVALKPLCAGLSASFLNGSQTERELPHAERSGSCFQLRLQGDNQSHQSHRSVQASGQFNFLKQQRLFQERL